MQLVAIVINLSSSPVQHNLILDRLRYYDLVPIIVPGIDAGSPLVDWYLGDNPKICRDQTATYLSHLKAIKAGLNRCPTADYYLILQDDAMFRDDFARNIIAWLDHDLDVIVLSGYNRIPDESRLPLSTCQPNLSWCHRDAPGTWSSTGYFISGQYASLAVQMLDRPFYLAPYHNPRSEMIFRIAPKAAYTDEIFILSDTAPASQLECDRSRFLDLTDTT